MSEILLEIVTPYKRVLSEQVEYVTAPGVGGEFGVLPGHTIFLTSLKSGEASFKKDGKTTRLAVGRGYADVSPDKTTLLVDCAEFDYEIDAAGAAREVDEADAALKGLQWGSPEYIEVSERLELANVKVKLASSAKA